MAWYLMTQVSCTFLAATQARFSRTTSIVGSVGLVVADPPKNNRVATLDHIVIVVGGPFPLLHQ